MRKYFFVVYFQLITAICFSQHIVVTNNKMNILYIGVDNPLTLVAEKYTPEKIDVKSDNGTIIGGYGGIYIFRGYNPGKTSILVSDKATGKEIGRSEFILKKIPAPVAKVSTISGGMINTLALKAQIYIRAVLDDNLGFDIKFNVERFKAKIIKKNTKEIKYFTNTTNKFEDNFEKEIKNLSDGDKVIFTQILVKFPDKSLKTIKPIIFKCSDKEIEGTCEGLKRIKA